MRIIYHKFEDKTQKLAHVINLQQDTMTGEVSYPIFMPKPSTYRMHDPGSIIPHIRPKVFTDNQMSRIKYNYYISNVSKDYDDSQ
jgi:hypothetical protein